MTDPIIYRTEMLDVVARAIDEHPRSQQTRIGPSQLGTPCARKLGHRLAETPVCASRTTAWRPTVGTAVHTWLTTTFNNANRTDRARRWITDQQVTVGTVDGVVIDGHLDLYDSDTHTVVDWKIPGPTSLAKKKRNGPGVEYETQVQLYGRGVVAMGLPCDYVGILFMPANGELADSHYWQAPYDEKIALDALSNADGIAAAIRLLGADVVLPQLDTANDYCSWCSWFKPGTTDLSTSCPGDPSISTKPGDQFRDLVAT